MRNRATSRSSLLSCTALTLILAAPLHAQETTSDPTTFLGRLVFGAGSERVAIDVPQAVTALEEDDIDQAQADTLGDVIERVPGVSLVGSESPFGESFNIRGIGGGASADEPRIVMSIDGVSKYYEQYRVGSLFTDPEFFRRVEILRGPSSSTLYGSGAIAGVIAMETRSADDFLEDGDDFAFRQRLQFSSNGNGLLSTSFLAWRPNEQFDALLGYSYRESDELENGDGNDIAGTRGTLNTSLVSLGYNFGNDLDHRLEFVHLNTTSFVDDQLYNLVDSDVSWGTNDRDVTDTTTYLRYNFDPAHTDLVDLQVQLSYAQSNIVQSDRRGFPLSLAGDVEYNYETTTLSIENSSEWRGSNWENFLTAGLAFSDHTRTASPVGGGRIGSHPEGTMDRFSIYAQNEFVWNDRLTAIVGVRNDRQTAKPSASTAAAFPGAPAEDDASATALNLALHYQFTDAFAMFGSVSRTERAPVIDEIFADRFGYGPSFGLEPEESFNYELGVALSWNDVVQGADSLSLKAVYFNNHIENMIVGNSATPGPTVPAYLNLDEVRLQGFEMEAAYASDNWYGSLAFSRTIGKNIGDPGALNPNLENQIPADTLTLGLGYQTLDGAWDFGWQGTWRDQATRYQATRGGGSTTLTNPSHFIHDLYAVYRPQNGSWKGSEIRLGVENILDEQYRTHLQSPTTSRAGRTATLTLTRTF
jgi:hemoglobin/transferrin/lactoferrin receptor protein